MDVLPLSTPVIDQTLAQYARFGVELGLERMQTLLKRLGNPQQQVPVVHVAGTNGKGSVCAYLSAVLTAAGYRVGRYTSPHLVGWCERISINDRPIAPDALLATLRQVEDHIDGRHPCPTQFEVFTAAAWAYFVQQHVDIAVVEVGLGGRLDATNVIDAPLVSVITSIGRDHWQRLGPTLADIAGEKAGILKAGRPAVIGPLPAAAAAVVSSRCAELGCPTHWPSPAVALADGQGQVEVVGGGYPAVVYRLPFPGEHQRQNSALALAAVRSLQQQGWDIPERTISRGLVLARWPGRLQWIQWLSPGEQAYPLLIDGAHNGPAAQALRAYVDNPFPPPPGAVSLLSAAAGRPPVTWIMGMLSTKDHQEVLSALLRPGDSLHLVPVPGHSSAEPDQLAAVAAAVCPDLRVCRTYGSLEMALDGIATTAATTSPSTAFPWTVLCGSLYLVGHFFATQATVPIAPAAE